MVYMVVIPGSIGAFLGATFLSNIPGELAKPYVSIFLLVLGAYVLFRFLFNYKPAEDHNKSTLTKKQSIPLGFIAGFMDATGGGGWGPIATPVLLSKNAMSARKVVGTVDTSEFAIAVSASIGFYFFRMGRCKLVVGDSINYRRSDCGPNSSMACSKGASSVNGCSSWRVYHFCKL